MLIGGWGRVKTPAFVQKVFPVKIVRFNIKKITVSSNSQNPDPQCFLWIDSLAIIGMIVSFAGWRQKFVQVYMANDLIFEIPS